MRNLLTHFIHQSTKYPRLIRSDLHRLFSALPAAIFETLAGGLKRFSWWSSKSSTNSVWSFSCYSLLFVLCGFVLLAVQLFLACWLFLLGNHSCGNWQRATFSSTPTIAIEWHWTHALFNNLPDSPQDDKHHTILYTEMHYQSRNTQMSMPELLYCR